MKCLNRAAALVCGGLLIALAAGCGDGAYEPSDVVLKPKASGGGADATASNGATDGGGDTATDGAPTGSGFGTFKGRVVYVGTESAGAPKVEKGANVKDAEVCAVNPVPDESIVLGPDNGLANVFIYMVKAPKGGKPQAGHQPQDQVFNQKGCLFIPHAMVMQVGKPFTITSDDAVPHNVHSRPKRAKEINMVVNPGVGQKTAYDKSEVDPAPVGCDFHNWMLAYHLPLDHPYGTVSAEDGTFEIQDLPVGKHSFRIWHEGKLINGSYQVTIPEDGAVVDQTIEVQ